MILLLASIALALSAAPAQAVQVKNLALSKITPDTAVLVVKADVTVDVTVDFGVASGVYGATKNGSGLTRHEILLDGLAPASVVYYRVTMTDSANPADSITLPEYSFHTARTAGTAFSYAVAGDNRPWSDTTVQPAIWYTIVGQMAVEDIDMSLNVGDFIWGVGGDSLAQSVARYEGLFAATMRLTAAVPLYPALGNHERVDAANSRAGFEQQFTLPVNNGADAGIYGEHYYSFDNGDTHFIALSTEIPGQEGMITGNQRAWLEADLAAATSKWIVVFMHRPLFSGAHAGDPWVNTGNAAGQANKAEIHNLFLSRGVDIVFEGHDHYYLRHEQDGIQYIITGGGGAPLGGTPMLGPGDVFGAGTYEHVKVDETANALQVSAVDTAGATLESFTIGVPSLSLSEVSAYWSSYASFVGRDLSVDYSLTNDGPGDAVGIQIMYLVASGGVAPQSVTPFSLTDLAATQSESFTVNYRVPFGVQTFWSHTYAVCNDLGGAAYSFSGLAPAV
ncbi:MAG: metallophosphoesterase [Actinobacteria bacterium]|nr:metallophosphoesterase [Actinomycetota bacterium]